jgi:hypothetical protein
MKKERQIIKVWVTKYALTSGIFEAQAEICADIDPQMISLKRSQGHLQENFHGKDWHTSVEAAFKRANEMKEKKIVSLEKQIEELRKKKF